MPYQRTRHFTGLILRVVLFIMTGTPGRSQSVMVTPAPPGWTQTRLDQINGLLNGQDEHPSLETLNKAWQELFEAWSASRSEPGLFETTFRLIAAVEKGIDPGYNFEEGKAVAPGSPEDIQRRLRELDLTLDTNLKVYRSLHTDFAKDKAAFNALVDRSPLSPARKDELKSPRPAPKWRAQLDQINGLLDHFEDMAKKFEDAHQPNQTGVSPSPTATPIDTDPFSPRHNFARNWRHPEQESLVVAGDDPAEFLGRIEKVMASMAGTPPPDDPRQTGVTRQDLLKTWLRLLEIVERHIDPAYRIGDPKYRAFIHVPRPNADDQAALAQYPAAVAENERKSELANYQNGLDRLKMLVVNDLGWLFRGNAYYASEADRAEYNAFVERSALPKDIKARLEKPFKNGFLE